ncbi:MAG: PHP domain-containing protein [Rickettsiales bacterium]|nr:PHP domain-containing protein [Rickettsiales bacterium]
MFDFHLHTYHSDGRLSVIELLKLAEVSGLKYISITDHNTINAYKDLKNIDIKKYFSGKIVFGIEMETKFDGCGIEVLGYGFDLNKLSANPLMKKYFPLSMKEYHTKKLGDYKVACKNFGIKFDENLTMEGSLNAYSSKTLFNDIIKYSENKKILEELGINSFDDFLNKFVFNKESPFFDSYFFGERPDIYEAIGIIKSAGGKVLLAHPFRYKMEGKELVEKINKLNILDGFECVNKAHNEEQIEYLIDFCDKHDLLKSGGSDFHRPVEHVMGYGDNGKYQIKEKLVSGFIKCLQENAKHIKLNIVSALANKEHIDRHVNPKSLTIGSKFLPNIHPEQIENFLNKFDEAYLNMIIEKDNSGVQVFAIECDKLVGTCAVISIENLTAKARESIFEIIRDFGKTYESKERVALISEEDMPTTNYIIGVYGPYDLIGNAGNLTMYTGYDFVPNPKELQGNESKEEIEANNRNKEYWDSHVFLCTPQELEANIFQLEEAGVNTSILKAKLMKFTGENPVEKVYKPNIPNDVVKLGIVAI